MENIQLLMHGFSTLFTFSNVGAALLGAVLGLVVGRCPVSEVWPVWPCCSR